VDPRFSRSRGGSIGRIPQEVRSSVRLAELADSIEDHIIVRDHHLMRPPELLSRLDTIREMRRLDIDRAHTGVQSLIDPTAQPQQIPARLLRRLVPALVRAAEQGHVCRALE
jgi:hypothetical protein